MSDDVTRSRQAAVERRLKEREELAALLRDAMDADEPVSWNEGYIPSDAFVRGADAVLAAGWRKPGLVHPVPNVDTVTEVPFGADHDPDKHEWEVHESALGWVCPCGARKWVT